MIIGFQRLATAAAIFSAPLYGRDTLPPAVTQQAALDPGDEVNDEVKDEEIVITGQRARGAALGDILPLETLDSRDVRATGRTC